MRSGILRHRLPGWIDPAAAYAALFRETDDSFWLDSSDGSGRSWIGSGTPLRPVRAGGSALLDAAHAALAERTVPAGARGMPLGLVGWFAYELGEWTVPAPGSGTPETGRESGRLLRVERLIEFDPAAAPVPL